MLEIIGYIALGGLGLVLGLLGAGGSILAVPILVYLFDVPPTQATGYSLVLVGATALVGSVAFLRRGESDPRMALLFGIPAVVAVYATRRFLMPAIPDVLWEGASVAFTKDAMVMLVFAAFMLAAAGVMILDRERTLDAVEPHELRSPGWIFAAGAAVGVFTGFVGAGGGFMILPVLVILGGLPIKVAIGTDLIVIATKSLVGFVGELQAVSNLDLGLVLRILALPLAGIVLGSVLNQRVPARLLKPAFGWFVLAMGLYIAGRELISI